MSSWVTPGVAAELWGVSLEQVLAAVADGSVPTRIDGYFLFVNLETGIGAGRERAIPRPERIEPQGPQLPFESRSAESTSSELAATVTAEEAASLAMPLSESSSVVSEQELAALCQTRYRPLVERRIEPQLNLEPAEPIQNEPSSGEAVLSEPIKCATIPSECATIPSEPVPSETPRRLMRPPRRMGRFTRAIAEAPSDGLSEEENPPLDNEAPGPDVAQWRSARQRTSRLRKPPSMASA